MNYDQYQRESQRLREVLADAVNRGDYHLEMDVIELLEKLEAKYQGDEE